MLQPKIINVTPTEDYKLVLIYESGEKKNLMLNRILMVIGTRNYFQLIIF